MGKVWLRYFLHANYVSFAQIRIGNIFNMRNVFSLCKQTHVLERNGFMMETWAFWLTICSTRVPHKIETKQSSTQHLYKSKVKKTHIFGRQVFLFIYGLPARKVNAGILPLRFHMKQVSAEYGLQMIWHFIYKTALARFVFIYGIKMGSPCTSCQGTKMSLM